MHPAAQASGVGPQQRVYMPHITAKTLAQQLQQMIAAFEEAVGVEVPTMDQVQVAFNKYQQAGAEGRRGVNSHWTRATR